jgi:hypothetical protein
MSYNKPEWKVIIDLLTKTNPLLLYRLTKRMIYYLVTKNISQIDELIKELEGLSEDSEEDNIYTNMPHPKFCAGRLQRFVTCVFEIANEHILDDDIADQLSIWLCQERGRFLSNAVQNLNIPLVNITTELNKFVNIPGEELCISPEEYMGIRVALVRRFLTFNLTFINIARKYITVMDFSELVKHIIGPAQGSGRLGGKSSGILLAYKILESARNKYPELKIKVPRSWYMTSDSLQEFIRYNAMEEFSNLKYMNIEEIKHGYPYLQQIFKNSFFPPEIVNSLARIIDQTEDIPLIIRSSSLLEDSFVATFAGKYKSLFLPNQGTRAERLNDMLDAISEVYASTYGPDPIQYRREKGLIDFNEEMGILIQEVVGTKRGKYFFPTFAGVAFTHNEFRWSPRIKREDGAVRLVMGLGTRAVDRVSNDYPFIISPGNPSIKVNVSYENIKRYSQHFMDVLNLETKKFETLPVEHIIQEAGSEIPGLNHMISVDKSGYLMSPVGVFDIDESDFNVTFQGLIEKTPFLKNIKIIMEILKKEFNFPVDVEFASDGLDLYILQCRPQGQGKLTNKDITIPDDIPGEYKIFSAVRYVTNASIEDIEYIVYIDPDGYNSLESMEDMRNVAKIVGKLNSILPKRKFILMGPGRWGSRGDISLGVSVTYSDVNNTVMLIEIARNMGNYVPELSFGTHFFQDLVEADIHYLPLYPDQDRTIFNEDFLLKSPNKLAEFLREYKFFSNTVRVISIKDVKHDASLSVIMDGNTNRALAFLKENLS